ncbi:DUF6676 family protein [Nocardia sp. NPDC049149]|uniref:Rv1476 family membrane protein n=1 Tax=Nocardia sp. NPDC049149 TaxID=3364315 RepID=UPI00371E9100
MTVSHTSVFTPMAAGLPPNVTEDMVTDTILPDLADDRVATLTGKDEPELAAIVAAAGERNIPLSIVVVPGNPGHDSNLRDLATEVGKTQHGTVLVLSDDWVGTYSDSISRVRLEWAEDVSKSTQGHSAVAAQRFLDKVEQPEAVSWTTIASVLVVGTVAAVGGLYWVKVRRAKREAADGVRVGADVRS